jgi:hypothetical protein
MARMGHDRERAAMTYQHEARGTDQLITNAIDAHVQGEQGKDDGDEDGAAAILLPAGQWHGRSTTAIGRPGCGRTKPTLTWVLDLGAGDGNRTRIISLGICAVRACHMA